MKEYSFVKRLWVVITAIVFAWVLFIFLVKPKILEPMCLINTNNCIQIEYQKYKNSVLIHLLPLGNWIWFDGKNIIVYGEPTGKVCNDPNYESAYVINTDLQKIEGYICSLKISKVINFYNDKKSKKEYIYKRSKKNKTYNVYDVMNILINKKIIVV